MHEVDDLLLAVHVELRVDGLLVALHCVLRQKQCLADEREVAPLGKQVQDVLLAVRQPVVVGQRVAAQLAHALLLLRETPEQLVRRARLRFGALALVRVHHPDDHEDEVQQEERHRRGAHEVGRAAHAQQLRHVLPHEQAEARQRVRQRDAHEQLRTAVRVGGDHEVEQRQHDELPSGGGQDVQRHGVVVRQKRQEQDAGS